MKTDEYKKTVEAYFWANWAVISAVVEELHGDKAVKPAHDYFLFLNEEMSK